MCYITFALLFKYEQGLIVLIQEVVIIANVKPFHTKSVMNKPQVIHVWRVERRRRRINTLQQ